MINVSGFAVSQSSKLQKSGLRLGSPVLALCLPPRLQAPTPRWRLPSLKAQGESTLGHGPAWGTQRRPFNTDCSFLLRAQKEASPRAARPALQARCQQRRGVPPLRPACRGGGAGAGLRGSQGRQACAAPGLQAEPRQRGQPRGGRQGRRVPIGRAAAACSHPGAMAAAAAVPEQQRAGRRGCGSALARYPTNPGGSALARPPGAMAQR